MTKKKINEYVPSKLFYLTLFALPIVFCLMMTRKLDNDLWYLLSEGRYIIQNGIYHIDPLSMHEGLNIIVQNWLSASIFWIIFNAFGETGILTLVLIANFFIELLVYKLCMKISDNNRVLSLVVMFATDVTLISHFVVSRPQIFSFIILLGTLNALESYIKTDNGKYLIWLPILSLIEINLHASLWWMIFLFTLPYLLDSFKIPLLQMQGYRKKPLFIAVVIALLVGFINPYGYQAITFIFTSYGNKFMHSYIQELLPFSFNNTLCFHMFIIIAITGLIYVFFRNGKIRFRYICLYMGTLLLGLMSIKGFSHFILVSMFPIAYLLKDIFPKDFSDISPKFMKILDVLFGIVSALAIIFGIVLYAKSGEQLKLSSDAGEAMDMVEKYGTNDDKIYCSFNVGGYVEYRGFKPYIDPRAEVYLKKNNKKEDIFEEYYNLEHNIQDIKEFLDKYNFDFLLVHNSDVLYEKLDDIENLNYFVLYNDTATGFKLYVRNDKFSDLDRIKMINTYNKAVNNAKAQKESEKE